MKVVVAPVRGQWTYKLSSLYLLFVKSTDYLRWNDVVSHIPDPFTQFSGVC